MAGMTGAGGSGILHDRHFGKVPDLAPDSQRVQFLQAVLPVPDLTRHVHPAPPDR